MSTVVISGTGTDIGKTVVTAALAATALAAGKRVAVIKVAQTGVLLGEPGDAHEVARLAGPVGIRELARYPEPLAPNTAARRAGMPALKLEHVVTAVERAGGDHDLVLVEGAGGLLTWFDDAGLTIVEVARQVRAPVLITTAPGLGTLNVTAMTTHVLRENEVPMLGLVLGGWPEEPDLAMRCNLLDLPVVSGLPLLGVLPDGSGALSRAEFRERARASLCAELDGELDVSEFVAELTGVD